MRSKGTHTNTCVKREKGGTLNMGDSPRDAVTLDLRDAALYAAGHVSGAFSFPWETVVRHCARLPPRHVDLRLITTATGAEVAEVRRYFTQSGYDRLTIASSDEVDGSSLAPPPGFCWRPNPFLSRHISHLAPGVALDVGSGAGRDLVFLAAHGWSVIGFDNRVHLAARCRDFAVHHDCDARTGVCVVDARRPLPFRRGSFDLVHVCRFLHRPLIPALVALLRPGGHLLYSHFLEGCERSARGFPRSDAGFFRCGELESLVAAEALTVLEVEHDHLDDGRPMVHILAQRSSLAD